LIWIEIKNGAPIKTAINPSIEEDLIAVVGQKGQSVNHVIQMLVLSAAKSITMENVDQILVWGNI